MKKIMFNDKYGLTKAVFEGRKTQTRRILNPTILFERLNILLIGRNLAKTDFIKQMVKN